MGQAVVRTVKRLLEYPMQDQPICFVQDADYSTTGELLSKPEEVDHFPQTEYDGVIETFYKKLAEERRQSCNNKNVTWNIDFIVQRYPGWNHHTIQYLHTIFLLYDSNFKGMNYIDFVCVLICFGDASDENYRKNSFNEIDSDADGWITFDEFLNTMYYFNPLSDGQLAGVSRRCHEIAETGQLIECLSLSQQMEFGLF